MHVFNLQILEELGVLRTCKRFAGTSGGAFFAVLLSVGLRYDEIHHLIPVSLTGLLLGVYVHVHERLTQRRARDSCKLRHHCLGLNLHILYKMHVF